MEAEISYLIFFLSEKTARTV